MQTGGNAILSQLSDPHQEFDGLNTLIIRYPIQITAKECNLTLEQVQLLIESARQKLFNLRTQVLLCNIQEKNKKSLVFKFRDRDQVQIIKLLFLGMV